MIRNKKLNLSTFQSLIFGLTLITFLVTLAHSKAWAIDYYAPTVELYNQSHTPAVWHDDFLEKTYDSCMMSDSNNPTKTTSVVLGSCLSTSPNAGPRFPIQSFEAPCVQPTKTGLNYGFIKDHEETILGSSVEIKGEELQVIDEAGYALFSAKKNENFLSFKTIFEGTEYYGYCWK